MSRLAGDWVRRGWEGRWVWDTGEESLRPAEDEGPLRTQRETVWSPGKGGRTYLGGVQQSWWHEPSGEECWFAESNGSAWTALRMRRARRSGWRGWRGKVLRTELDFSRERAFDEGLKHLRRQKSRGSQRGGREYGNSVISSGQKLGQLLGDGSTRRTGGPQGSQQREKIMEMIRNGGSVSLSCHCHNGLGCFTT